jgi:hypothetical protein
MHVLLGAARGASLFEPRAATRARITAKRAHQRARSSGPLSPSSQGLEIEKYVTKLTKASKPTALEIKRCVPERVQTPSRFGAPIRQQGWAAHAV